MKPFDKFNSIEECRKNNKIHSKKGRRVREEITIEMDKKVTIYVYMYIWLNK